MLVILNMSKAASTDKEPLPELNWPEFKWRVGTWLTIASTLLSFAIFIFPSLSQNQFDGQRIPVAVLVALLPFLLVSAFPWLLKVGQVAAVRAKLYPRLMGMWRTQGRDLAEIKGAMAEFVQHSVRACIFDVERASYTKGRLYVLVARQTGHEMAVGDDLEVIDREDNVSMGQFQVTEVREKVYYACGISYVDPVWLGYVQERGEIGVMPNIVAIHIPKGGQNDK